MFLNSREERMKQNEDENQRYLTYINKKPTIYGKLLMRSVNKENVSYLLDKIYQNCYKNLLL